MKKLLALIIVLAILIYAITYVSPRLPTINGYASHLACSCLYLSDRSLESIKEEDLNFFPLNFTQIKHDDKRKQVSSSLLGFGSATSVYKDGLGCTLLKGKDDYNIQFKTGKPQLRWNENELAFPYGRNDSLYTAPGLNREAIDTAIDKAFDADGLFEKKTRAVVVLKDGRLVTERYAQGFDKDTPLLGWSMTKSIINALVAILVKEEQLDLTDKFREDQWSYDVSLKDLLQMNSGIEWNEDYFSVSDATNMLYNSESCAEAMADNVSEFKPGTSWEYNSGSSNYISGIIRNSFEKLIEYQAFPYFQLFMKIDANSFTLEADESGNFILSSYGHATARDWSKLGQLYLNNGNWLREQLFPENWVSESIKANPVSPQGNYGMHLWLNNNHNFFPSCPEDLYFFSGFQGQYVCIIPSKNIVITRLGLSKGPAFNMDRLIQDILAAFE